MSEERTVNRKLTQIKKYCETYILKTIENDPADENRMARFKTRIKDLIIKIYTDHPGYKDTIDKKLFLIERNTFGVYFNMYGFNDDTRIIIASNHFLEMAKKYHDQQNLPVIASASCNSTRTVGGKKKNKSKTRRRSRI